VLSIAQGSRARYYVGETVFNGTIGGVRSGLGRIVGLYYRSSALYYIS
jgi:hypothetical protein